MQSLEQWLEHELLTRVEIATVLRPPNSLGCSGVFGGRV
jgi:hypothetical protein